MLRRIIILLILFFVARDVSGQNDHIYTDTSALVDIELIDGGSIRNSQVCQRKQGDKIIEYTPYELSEYGFANGKSYVSKSIIINNEFHRVFMERLVKGPLNLYYYMDKHRKRFFLENESLVFIELVKRDSIKKKNAFRNMLHSFCSDCSNLNNAIKLVSYNRKSLSELIERYNSCEIKPFPFFKIGVFIGYSSTKLLIPPNNTNRILKNMAFNYDGAFTTGIFIDHPLYVAGLSMHSEISCLRNGFSANKKNNDNEIELVINISELNIPMMLKYTYPSMKLRPFINTGILYTYHIKNENTTYESVINQNEVDTHELGKMDLISKNQIGFSIGSGINYFINHRNSFFMELRYNQSFGLTFEVYGESLNKNIFQLISGFSF